MVDTPPLTGKSSIFTPLNSDPSEYLTGVYSRGSFVEDYFVEETKLWLRKLIRRKVLNKSDASKYQIVIAPQESLWGKTWAKVECVYQQPACADNCLRACLSAGWRTADRHKNMIIQISNFKP